MADNQTISDFWNNSTSANNSFEGRIEIPTLGLDEITVCCIINLLIEVFGNGLLILMIITEKFLMDPQKRTVINQLITHLNYVYLLNNLIAAPILTYIIIAGAYYKLGNVIIPVRFHKMSNKLFSGHELAVFMLYFSCFVYWQSLFTLVQITILNLLYINCWNRMMAIDENFLSSICIQMNYILSTFLFTVRFFTEQHIENRHYQATRRLFGLKGPLTELYPTIKFW